MHRGCWLSDVDEQVDERGNSHAAESRSHRRERVFEVPQPAGDELGFELKPNHEEEHREQAVGGPVPD